MPSSAKRATTMLPIDSIRRALFYGLVLLAPFSLLPSLALPVAQFSSFRIGAYQVMALVFVLICCGPMIRDYIQRPLTKQDRLVYGAALLLLATIAYSLGKAIDPARSLLMSISVSFLLLLVLIARWYVQEYPLDTLLLKRLLPKLAIFYGVVSLVQLLVGTFWPDNALLCKGCGSQVFGFVRINGFAAEPLFWANALLLFWLGSLGLYVHSLTRLHGVALLLTTCSIALTFSRGAMAAVAIMWLLCAICYKKRMIKPTLIIISAVVVGFMLLVLSASIRYRDTPGILRETASGIIEHLSFGRMKLVEEATPETQEQPAIDSSNFDSQGYVEASTTERTTSAELAIEAWSTNTLFGVGLGNLGPYVQRYVDASAPGDLTVYIYYVLFLSEVGIVGVAMLGLLYAAAFKNLLVVKTNLTIYIVILLAGYLVHYVFFGSTINVVYIWLWLGIGLGYHKSNEKINAKKVGAVS